jgi:large-conductance mechanosensitive channel
MFLAIKMMNKLKKKEEKKKSQKHSLLQKNKSFLQRYVISSKNEHKFICLYLLY